MRNTHQNSIKSAKRDTVAGLIATLLNLSETYFGNRTTASNTVIYGETIRIYGLYSNADLKSPSIRHTIILCAPRNNTFTLPVIVATTEHSVKKFAKGGLCKNFCNFVFGRYSDMEWTANCHKFNVPNKMRAEPNASSGYAEAEKGRKDFNAFSPTT